MATAVAHPEINVTMDDIPGPAPGAGGDARGGTAGRGALQRRAGLDHPHVRGAARRTARRGHLPFGGVVQPDHRSRDRAHAQLDARRRAHTGTAPWCRPRSGASGWSTSGDELLEPVCREVVDRLRRASSEVDLRTRADPPAADGGDHASARAPVGGCRGARAVVERAVHLPVRSRRARWRPRPSSPTSWKVMEQRRAAAGRRPREHARHTASSRARTLDRRGDPLVPAPAVPGRDPQHDQRASATCSSRCWSGPSCWPGCATTTTRASGPSRRRSAGSRRSATSPGGRAPTARCSTASSSRPTRRWCTRSPPRAAIPAMFPDPDRFDLDRRPQEMLTFGLGEHFCLGAWLGRQEMRVALDVMLERTRHLELADVEARAPSRRVAARAAHPSRDHRVVRASIPMDLPVPEHVRPIRDRFHEFVQERIIPREQEMYSWWVDGDPGATLMAELRAAGEGRGSVGHRPPEGGRRRRHAVPRLRVHQRGHRPLRARGVGVRHRHAAGLVDAARVRVTRVARPVPRAARRRRDHPELRDDRARRRVVGRHAAPDDGGARRRRVGDQRPEVVHQPRALREVHDGDRAHRGATPNGRTSRSRRSSCPPTPRATTSCARCRCSASSRATTARSSTTTCACRRATCSAQRGQGFLLGQKRLGPGRVFHAMRFLGRAATRLRLHVRPRRAARRVRWSARRQAADPADGVRDRSRDPGLPPHRARRRRADGPRAIPRASRSA